MNDFLKLIATLSIFYLASLVMVWGGQLVVAGFTAGSMLKVAGGVTVVLIPIVAYGLLRDSV